MSSLVGSEKLSTLLRCGEISVVGKYREVAAFSTGSQYKLVPKGSFYACQVGILVLICTNKLNGKLPRSSMKIVREFAAKKYWHGIELREFAAKY